MKIKATLLLAFAAIVWGASFLPSKLILEVCGVYEYLFYRFIISSFLFFIIVFKDIKNNYKNSYLGGSLSGICMAIAFILQTLSLKYIQSSSVAFLTGLNVIMVPFLSLILFKKIPSLKTIFLCFLACFGLYLFQNANINSFYIGEFLSLACALFFALLIVLVEKFLKDNDLNSFVFFQFFACAVVCFFAALFLDKISLAPLKDMQSLIYIIISAMILTIFCFFAQNYAQKFLQAQVVAILLLLEPISAGIIGYYFGEDFTKLQIVGIVLILLALAFC